MSTGTVFDKSRLFSYLGLPDNYEPSPETSTIAFLSKHLTELPPHLLIHFNHLTSAKERTAIPKIRNRRLKYTAQKPSSLEFTTAKTRWPNLWQGKEVHGVKEAKEEKEWVEKDFVRGSRKHVGKLGELLGGYEEQREAERVRNLKRMQFETVIPEEDESSESDDEYAEDAEIEEDSQDQAKASFERLIRERLIYGLLEASSSSRLSSYPFYKGSLQPFEYDEVDWDDSLDSEDEREAEDRWFDEDE